ncbi:MAG: hypothetical protein AB2A00_01615 [Myxococcota bacterium]
MPSPTSHTETVRKSKKHSRGRKRKNALQNHGTTKSQKELFKKVS